MGKLRFRPAYGSGAGMGLAGLEGPDITFSPADIAGLILWLKADAGTWQDSAKTTIATSDGDVIGAWADRSGNGNDVTQAATANKPVLKLAVQNGRSVVRFDGTNDYLQGALGTALSQPVTAFLVAQLDASVVNDNTLHIALDGDDVTNRLMMRQSPSPTPDDWGIYAGTELNDGASNSNWNIWSGLFNGASGQFWLNGASVATGNVGAQNADGITVGARYDGGVPWKGDIAEVLIYDPSLSTDDRQRIEQYLSARWGITLP